jgi:hypothetical protein
MEAGPLLYALLSQAAPVAALLAAPGGQDLKIYPVVAPQDTERPYVNYQLISGGPEAGSSAICRLGDVARVQLSVFADDYPTLASITAALRAVLDYAEPEPGVYLTLDNQQDHYEANALCLFRSLDYVVELP